VSRNIANLKPWPKGVSGNPGGRPRTKPITEELERLLQEEAPNDNGQTWAAVIAEALLHQARKGDVRAISELANRIEGKPLQALDVSGEGVSGLAERLQRARQRVIEGMSEEELDERINRLEQEIGMCESCRGRIGKLR
jgi:hypothetical protein